MRKFYLLIGAEILLILIISFLSSCQSGGEQETSSGILYENVRKGEGESPQEGQILLMSVAYSDAEGNELFTTQPGLPVTMIYDSSLVQIDGGIEECIRLMEIGDSIVAKFPAERLFENTFKQPLPPEIVRGSLLTINIGLEDAMSETEFQEYRAGLEAKLAAEAEAKSAEQLKIDAELLEEYFAENNITAETHPSGLRYVIHEEGSGVVPNRGQSVRVAYAGKFLDGELFDTSILSIAEENGAVVPGREYEPYTFPLGVGQVIQGWDIGIGVLKEGSKATLYVPSGLAYGPRDGGRIPANSILMFDVELVEVIE